MATTRTETDRPAQSSRVVREEQIATFLAERVDRCAASTLAMYGSYLRSYDRWSAAHALEPYTSASVKAYIVERAPIDRNDTLRNRIRYLELFCNWLEARGAIGRNPFRGEDAAHVPPRRRRRREVYTEDDVVRLLAATGPTQWKAGERRTARQQWQPDGPMRREQLQGRALVLLLVDSALRAAEAASLTCGQVRARLLLVRSKGGHVDVAFISEETRGVLLELVGVRPDADPLFRDWNNRRCTTRGIRGILGRLATRAGVALPERPLHAFRHYAARQWLKAGVPDLTIRQWMRHESLATTRIYTELDAEELSALHAQASQVGGLLQRAGLKKS